MLKTRGISLEPVFVIYVFGIYIDKFTQILNGCPLFFPLQIMLIYQDMRIIIRKRFKRDQDRISARRKVIADYLR